MRAFAGHGKRVGAARLGLRAAAGKSFGRAFSLRKSETPVFLDLDPAILAQFTQTKRPVEEANVLAPVSYSCKDIAEVETTRLWSKNWVCVGSTDNVREPGTVYPFNVMNFPLFAANHNGEIKAFHNVCRHRGAQLVTQCAKKKKIVTCPYHRWGYALDGRLVGTPMWDTNEQNPKVKKAFATDHLKDFDKTNYGLLPARMDEWGGMMFVNLDGEAPPLQDYLGDLPGKLDDYPFEDMVVARRKSYDVGANWKCMIENFLEYYHLPAVHPALCEVSTVDAHVHMQGDGFYSCFATAPLTYGGTPLDPDKLPTFPGLTGGLPETAVHLSIFPNMFCSIYPHHIFRVVVRPNPNDPKRCFEEANLMIHKDVASNPEYQDQVDAIFAFHDNVNMEDIGVCELVQKGLGAYAYNEKPGRFAFKFEKAVHRFQNMVIDTMVNEKHIPPPAVH